MSDITDAGPRLRAMNDALEENDRLQAEIDHLRSRPCPYVTGGITRYCTLTPLTLTDAEREAIAWAVSAAEDCQHPADDALRGLLDRTNTGEK